MLLQLTLLSNRSLRKTLLSHQYFKYNVIYNISYHMTTTITNHKKKFDDLNKYNERNINNNVNNNEVSIINAIDIFHNKQISNIKINHWADLYMNQNKQNNNSNINSINCNLKHVYESKRITFLYDLLIILVSKKDIEIILQILYKTYPDIIQLLMYIIDDLNILKRHSKEISNNTNNTNNTNSRDNRDISEYIDVMLSSIRNYLSIVLADNMLKLEQIKYETSSGQVLELISSTEGVHKIRALSQLKHRLDEGRMCWALFSKLYSPSTLMTTSIDKHTNNSTTMSNPLVYIHVALSDSLLTSMKSVFEAQANPTPACAIFYSVNSPHRSLSALGLAPVMIRRVAMELACKFPSLVTFCTLSPIPLFVPWVKKTHRNNTHKHQHHQEHVVNMKRGIVSHLQQKEISELSEIHQLLCDVHNIDSNPNNPICDLPSTTVTSSASCMDIPNTVECVKDDSKAMALIEDIYNMIIELFYMEHKRQLLDTQQQKPESKHESVFLACTEPYIKYMVCYYLLYVKNIDGVEPYDPVARFHLRNGAILKKINFHANMTMNGFDTSMTCMVNYSYSTTHYDALDHESRQMDYRCDPTKFPRSKEVSDLVNKFY